MRSWPTDPAGGPWAVLVDGTPTGAGPAGPLVEVLGLERPLGVFTTARVSEGRMERADRHRRRLLDDGRALGLARAEALAMAADQVAAEGTRAARAAGLFGARATLRMALWREETGALRRAVTLEPERRPVWTPDQGPLRLLSAPDPRSGPAVKALDRSALEPLEARARSEGATGVLLLGPDEVVREGTWFHVFALLGERWVTPPLEAGVIDGTTRGAVLAALREAGLGEERALTLPVLEEARAVVVCSSLLGLAPVSHVGDAALRCDDGAVEALRRSVR